MRISTAGSFQSGVSMMQQLQQALDRTQQQISSGRRILTPSDDPIASARTVELRESLSRIEQFERNGEIARNRLSYEETALVSVNDNLQRVRELAVLANNDTQSPESRRLIAGELRERVDQLVQIANQRDGGGRYLFAGNKDGAEPVTTANGVFTYNGDQGQRLIQIAENRQIPDSDSGASVFFHIKDGNGTFSSNAAAANTGTGILKAGSVSDMSQYDRDSYTIRFTASNNYEVVDSGGAVISTSTFTPGDTVAFRGIEVAIDGAPAAGDEFNIEPSRHRDMFSSILDLASTLEQPVTGDTSRAVLHNGVNNALQNIDQAIGKVLDVRTQVGTRLSAIENQVESNASFELTLQTTLSGIEDLDYAEALSLLSVQASTLEAAQASFVRTQSLSLFNFL
jgi:flagellar hook-associated protein 3 FlgL